MNDLADLIARVEGASGPDRELDVALADALHPNVTLMPLSSNPEEWVVKIGDKWVPTTRYPRGYMTTGDRYVQAYTSSLDAALGLVERVLPGWRWMVRRVYPEHDGRTQHVAYVESVDYGDYHAATAPTPALALILAMLRAKEASRSTELTAPYGRQSIPETEGP